MADKKSNRVWRVGRDEAGNAVLEWNPHTLRAERVEIYEGSDCDDLDLTGDLLRRRGCNLALDDNLHSHSIGTSTSTAQDAGRSPYDTGNSTLGALRTSSR
jgi:hypothetical protein